jgi:DNA replication and repair protein RecF
VLLTWVKLRDFRTYTRGQVSLSGGLTVVYGPNGAGKTNLLEAIYFGCTGRSLRTTNEREVVHFGAKAARVVVGVSDETGEHELSVGYESQSGSAKATKRMQVDGVSVERLSDSPSRPLICVFLPDRLELIKGSPSLRRAHMDQLVAALWPVRAATRRDYSRALLQRNALLAGIRAGRSSRSSLPSWDLELARLAIELSGHRAEATGLLVDRFRGRAQDLGLSGNAELEYAPRSRATSVDEFLLELDSRTPRDIERGFSMYGPHRDDLTLSRDRRELRAYGSQGEQRLALLALLLAERDVLTEVRGRAPLMLLDDVMSELDDERRSFLVEVLSSSGQSLITATDPGLVPPNARCERSEVSPHEIIVETSPRAAITPELAA